MFFLVLLIEIVVGTAVVYPLNNVGSSANDDKSDTEGAPRCGRQKAARDSRPGEDDIANYARADVVFCVIQGPVFHCFVAVVQALLEIGVRDLL